MEAPTEREVLVMSLLRRSRAAAIAVAAAAMFAGCAPASPLAEPTIAPESPAAEVPAAPTSSPTSAPTETAGVPEPPATPTPAAATQTAAAPTSAPATPTSAVATGAVVEVATSADHGDYLAVDGFALYTFTPDDPGSSNCYETCAENWPPLLAPVSAGTGVAGVIGEFERDGGEGTQVTYDDAPLYFFLADTEPGQTNGEGVGDVWFLARPSAEPAPGGGSGDDGDSDDGYEY